MLRTALVSNVFPERCSARVVFDDLDGLVTQEVPIMVQGTTRSKQFWLPSVGELVIVSALNGSRSDWVILGSIYNDEDEPEQTTSARRTNFEGGGFVEYDKAARQLIIDFSAVSGKVQIVLKNAEIVNK